MKSRQDTVGVRELRTRLSAYLREVARGRTVTIGDRRQRAVARIVPVNGSADAEVLESLAARGVVQLGIGKVTPTPIEPRRRGHAVADIVIEDRG